MLHGNVLSGAPFRVAILCLGFFIVILLTTGCLLYHLIDIFDVSRTRKIDS